MKRILDTVHGYIMIDDELFYHIIDTKLFQRLRRIEQTSVRSVYPSARHDRFIHSLGVYHIGTLIVNHLKNEMSSKNYWGENHTTIMVLCKSYLVACLLHDIAHAPFSHTFEKYYGTKEELSKLLEGVIVNNNFKLDLAKTNELDAPNFHEFMSAYVVYTEYASGIRHMNLDAEFICRMITGIYYIQENETHQIHNCFISLLHGKIIDADRLDYACRDVWASGYSTSTIDLRRLISAIHFERNAEKEYVVCFESNSLNEIEGLLNVKDFQQKYVLHHHVVCYEQWLLVKAVECMADRLFPECKNSVEATKQLISKRTVLEKLNVKNYNIENLSDDDLIFLLKQESENKYYEQWASRKYTHKALWKSRDEFYHFFSDLNITKDLKHKDFVDEITNAIVEHGKVKKEDVIIIPQEFKKRIRLENLYLLINKEVVRYTDIYQEARDQNINQTFYYVYVPIGSRCKEDWNSYKYELIKKMKTVITTLYTDENIVKE